MKFLSIQAKKQLGSLREVTTGRTELLLLLQKKKEYYTIWATVSAALGPLIITLLSIMWPVPGADMWEQPQIYVTLAVFIWTVSHVLFFTYKQVLFGLNIDEVKSEEHQSITELNELKNKNISLKHDRYLLFSAMGKIGRAARIKNCTLEQLATLVAEIIFHDIHNRFRVGNGLTVNMYDYKDHIINMRGHYQVALFDTNPLLFDENGLVDSDDRIENFCCVKLLKSGLQKKTLSNWMEMVDEFAWNHWDEKEKRKIKRKKDRRQCIDIGFTYNQYIGLTHKRDDGVEFLVEIILHNDEDITKESGMRIETIATGLKNIYTQLVDQIWNIGSLEEVNI